MAGLEKVEADQLLQDAKHYLRVSGHPHIHQRDDHEHLSDIHCTPEADKVRSTINIFFNLKSLQ